MEQGPKIESMPEKEIRTMPFEEYAEIHHETPYVYEISKGDKKVVYFGVEHSNNPNDSMFESIKERFRMTKPQMVFVEGFARLSGPSNAAFIQSCAEEVGVLDKKEVIERKGEAGFALKLAVENGIDFESPEAGLRKEIADLLEQGFAKEDIFASYLYELVDNYHEHRIGEKINGLTVEGYLESFIDKFQEATTTMWGEFDYSLENFERIGRKIFGERADIKDSSIHKRTDVIVRSGAEAKQTVVNEIIRQTTYIRDRYMVQRIKEVMKRYDRLFIVFGAGHAVMQEPAIRNLFQED